MRTVRVIYEYHPEGWVAESPDEPGWTAFGDSYHEVRELAHEGIPFFVEEEVSIVEIGIRFKTSEFPTSTIGVKFTPTRPFAGRPADPGQRPRSRPPTDVQPLPIPA